MKDKDAHLMMEALKEATLDKWPTDIAPGERSAPGTQPNSAVGARVRFKSIFLWNLATAEHNAKKPTKVVIADNGETVMVSNLSLKAGSRDEDFLTKYPAEGPFEKSEFFLMNDHEKYDGEAANSQYERFFPPESTAAAFEAEFQAKRKEYYHNKEYWADYQRQQSYKDQGAKDKVAAKRAAGMGHWPSDVDTGVGTPV